MTAAERGGLGALGWGLLFAALGVPGFLFYNWWSHLKGEHDHGVAVRARTRADEGVFQTPAPAENRLVNPMSASTAAPAGLAAGRPPLSRPTSAPPTAPAPVPNRAAPLAAPVAVRAATPAVAVSSAATVVLARDPMLSPLDLVRIQEAALEAEQARQRLIDEAARKKAPKPVRKRAAPPPVEKSIELQGIVAKPDGVNLAMINGSTINTGDSFTVDGYPGKVLVLKISSTEVTLDYKGRKIRLSVNAE